MRQVTLTQDHVYAGASRFGAWSKVQLALLGVAWPPKHGWKEKILGKPIDEDDLERFLSLKNKHKEVAGIPGSRKAQQEEYHNIAMRKNLI